MMRVAGLVPVEGSREVGLDDLLPVFRAHAEEKGIPCDAGIIDENVETTVFLGGLVGGGGHGLFICDVDGEGFEFTSGSGDGFSSCLGRFQRTADAHDGGAFLGQTKGDGFADATACAGDDRDLII